MGPQISVTLILVLFFAAQSALGIRKDTYTAAVVEYHPITDPAREPETLLNENVDKYIELLENIGDQRKLDIIVYPEATLDDTLFNIKNIDILTTVPSADEHVTPCTADSYPSFFKKLSCMAKEHSVYTVVNLVEKQACQVGEGCANYGYNLYNTDVVFDRAGTVIARYRKFNLFGERLKNRTKTAEHITFETDFGVTFGIFTCFDILFETPALDLVRQGVSNFIFPTMWFSELPFLTALQAQQMWAHENNVNLLAANANGAKVGSGGTGIFSGKNGPLILNITSDPTSKVYIAEVPKVIEDAVESNESCYSDSIDKACDDMDRFKLSKNNLNGEANIDTQSEDMDGFHFLQDFDTAYKSVLLNIDEAELSEQICDGDEQNRVCCNFNIKISVDKDKLASSKDKYKYMLVAFSGQRSFAGVQKGGIEACGLVHCTTNSLKSCGLRFPLYKNIDWPITFESIKVEANFTNILTKHHFPNSLLSSIRPISPTYTEWRKQLFDDGKVIQRTHVLLKPQDRLMTFGIYGRDFARDGQVTNQQPNIILH